MSTLHTHYVVACIFGISKKPTYSLFYHSLACFDMDTGDEDKTIDSLTRMHDPQFVDAKKEHPGRDA